MKTYQPKEKDIKRNWHLIDADGKVLGRLSTQIAQLLIGKHKVNYATHMDMGDNVVVINASKVILTGKKAADKVYFSHSGYPGGLKEVKYTKLMKDNPSEVITRAVTGMLPKNRTQKKRLARLKVYPGSNHKYKQMFAKETKSND